MKAIICIACFSLALLSTGPSEASDTCPLEANRQVQAREAFKEMLLVLRHPRCANCHGAMDVYDERTTHPGGPQVDYEEDFITGEKTAVPLGPQACKMCHDKGNGHWRQSSSMSEIQWAGLSDQELWKRLQTTRIIVNMKTRASKDSTGQLLLEHVRTDHLISLGFEGSRGMSENSYMASNGLPSPAPPPLSKAEFLLSLTKWIDALNARTSWPQEDCSVVTQAIAPRDKAPDLATLSGILGAKGYYVVRLSGGGWIKRSGGNATYSSGYEYFLILAKKDRTQPAKAYYWEFPIGYDANKQFQIWIKEKEEESRKACRDLPALGRVSRPHIWVEGPRYEIVYGSYEGKTPPKYGSRRVSNGKDGSAFQWVHTSGKIADVKAACATLGVSF